MESGHLSQEHRIESDSSFTRHEQPRHCKIVATLGPASSNDKTVTELIHAGVDIFRLNFSHGSHEQHEENIQRVRRLAKEAERPISILQDLQGPKIRVGKLPDEGIEIKRGSDYRLFYGKTQEEANSLPIDYVDLVNDVAEQQRVLMDDGLLSFQITKIQGQNVFVKAENSGTLTSRKGVNFPDAVLSLPAMTEKDSHDLMFGVRQQVDFVALSFVQCREDMVNIKKMIRALGSDIPVIGKIEKVSAINDIREIAEVADGLMVARGDLGVEGRVEKVPGYQRQIIRAAAEFARPVIIATQMLDSMIRNPRATIAEVTDVANGVLDGADCLMLSGEVASGNFPVECVQQMEHIIRRVENWTFKQPQRYETHEKLEDTNWQDHESIARAACEAADSLNARAIVCLTLTGSIAHLISKWRPKTPIIAISPRVQVVQRLKMIWGVYAMQNPLFYNTDVMLQQLPDLLKSHKLVSSGDTIVVTAGIPINAMKPTNMIKINKID